MTPRQKHEKEISEYDREMPQSISQTNPLYHEAETYDTYADTEGIGWDKGSGPPYPEKSQK